MRCQRKNVSNQNTICGTLSTRILLVLVLAAGSFVYTLAAYAYLEKTHSTAAKEGVKLIRKVDTGGLYRDVYMYIHLQKLGKGAADEDFGNVDGNNRSFRHYYDPDADTPTKGVKYHSYYQGWGYYDVLKNMVRAGRGDWEFGEETEVTEPRDGYYDNALEWARNAAGAEDLMNFEGALAVYDYTDYSREDAYEYLGHVVHLVADMAEPDHALNWPHPGSGYSAGDDYGFEALVEKYISTLDISGQSPQRRDRFDDYYNKMARRSKDAVRGNFDVPLGLDNIPGTDIYLIPDIDDADESVRNRYLHLAQKLLMYSVELTAGLLMDFHDIVTYPPYVRRVVITQEHQVKYDAQWHDTKSMVDIKSEPHSVVTDRDLRVSKDRGLSAGEPANITIYFGPTTGDGTRIASESVEVFLGKEEVEGSMLTDTIWIGLVTPAVSERIAKEQQKLSVSAKDIFNHYRRSGLPERGYELDSWPALPAKLAEYTPPYSWNNYDPGPDERHSLEISQAMPPAVESIRVFAGDKIYLDGRWEENPDTYKAVFKNTGVTEKDGINVDDDPTAGVVLEFTDSMRSDSVTLQFGSIEVPLHGIGSNTFTGTIPLYRFRKPGLDSEFTFTINGANTSELTLDGNAETMAYQDKRTKEWLQYEEGADTAYSLRVYSDIKEGEPGLFLKGYVFEWLKNDEHFDRLTGSPVLKENWRLAYRYNPISTSTPVPNCTVALGAGYYAFTDSALSEKFMELAKTRIAVGKKIKEGVRVISRAEYDACRELMEMKDKVLANLTFKSGSRPAWITTTDHNGEFEIVLDKYPGKENIFYIDVQGVAFKEGSAGTHYKFTSGGGMYYGFCPVIDEFITAEAMRINAREVSSTKAEEMLLAKMKERDQHKGLLEKYVATRDKKRKEKREESESLEPTWTERALNEQRQCEKDFIAAEGDPLDWPEETRKKFEEELAQISDKARKDWEEDMREFKEKWKNVFAELDQKIARQKKIVRSCRQDIDHMKKTMKEAEGRPPVGINFSMPILIERDAEEAKSYSCAVGGPFFGTTLTPSVVPGFFTHTFLIKQVIDDRTTGPLRRAKHGGTGYEGFSLDLNSERDRKIYQPPYQLQFDVSLPRHLLVYNYKHYTDEDGQTCLGAGAQTVFYRDSFSRIEETNLAHLWYDFQLQPVVEVEGMPVADKNKFSALLDELEQLKVKHAIVIKKLKALREKVYNGTVSRQAGEEKAKALWDELYPIPSRAVTILGELQRINPAF